MANIAVLGYGTVGSGVVEIVRENAEVLARKAGEPICVKHVLDLREFPGDPVEQVLTHRFEDILEDATVSVVVEVMGGVEPAYTFVRKCLLAGKSVCTSNKELVARHGSELIGIAKEKNINFLFEASVGGGIPILHPLMRCLTADEILEIKGIVNGTTNYILTEMSEEGKSFEEVLKIAQDLGYAERDPVADVEGHDACRKNAILSSLAFGKTVDFADIPTEGITKISGKDIAYAKQMKRTIKLLALAKRAHGGVSAQVAPYMLPNSHPLSRVNDVFNAVFVKGNMLGETMYYGKGAGKLPTASAVLSDVVDAVKHLDRNIPIDWRAEKQPVLSNKDVDSIQFVRIADAGREHAAAIFPQAVFVDLPEEDGEIGFITGPDTEAGIAQKLKTLAESTKILGNIRMED